MDRDLRGSSVPDPPPAACRPKRLRNLFSRGRARIIVVLRNENFMDPGGAIWPYDLPEG
jgi:hypothetical protein